MKNIMSLINIPRKDRSTILLVMVLKDNMERKAFLGLRVFQETEDTLGLQDHQEPKDQRVIVV